MSWRKRLFFLVESPDDTTENDKFDVYDVFMMITIIVSIFPLAFKTTNRAFELIDFITVIIFIIDYLLRWFTADLKLNKSYKSFFIYPLTPMAMMKAAKI